MRWEGGWLCKGVAAGWEWVRHCECVKVTCRCVRRECCGCRRKVLEAAVLVAGWVEAEAEKLKKDAHKAKEAWRARAADLSKAGGEAGGEAG